MSLVPEDVIIAEQGGPGMEVKISLAVLQADEICSSGKVFRNTGRRGGVFPGPRRIRQLRPGEPGSGIKRGIGIAVTAQMGVYEMDQTIVGEHIGQGVYAQGIQKRVLE